MSNTCKQAEKYFNGNAMNVRLYLVKVFYLRHGCKIEIS